jgi:phosphatidylglycerophosphate synthase
MNLRRVLILADESANWTVAGLRQLDRLALSLDEIAVENRETAPIEVCLFWRSDIDPAHRWIPNDPRLTHLAFTGERDYQPFDLILTTRLFLYRKAIRQLIADTAERGAALQPATWEDYFRFAGASFLVRPGAWEQMHSQAAIGEVERRFLRGSGKSQDGLVSRHLNRPLSRAITRLLLPFPVTPNAWTWLIFPIPIVAALLLWRGTYWSFVCGLLLFQVFSVLDGCDGEIARAKFMESESGRRLDDFFDVVSNILLVLGLGFGLARTHQQYSSIFFAEGIAAAVLIATNEWVLARAPESDTGADSLGGTLYPRHRALVERSGLLAFGEKFASLLIQLTKRDVAVLFFVFLALIGLPSAILHLLFVVTAVSLALAWRAHQSATSP